MDTLRIEFAPFISASCRSAVIIHKRIMLHLLLSGFQLMKLLLNCKWDFSLLAPYCPAPASLQLTKSEPQPGISLYKRNLGKLTYIPKIISIVRL